MAIFPSTWYNVCFGLEPPCLCIPPAGMWGAHILAATTQHCHAGCSQKEACVAARAQKGILRWALGYGTLLLSMDLLLAVVRLMGRPASGSSLYPCLAAAQRQSSSLHFFHCFLSCCFYPVSPAHTLCLQAPQALGNFCRKLRPLPHTLLLLMGFLSDSLPESMPGCGSGVPRQDWRVPTLRPLNPRAEQSWYEKAALGDAVRRYEHGYQARIRSDASSLFGDEPAGPYWEYYQSGWDSWQGIRYWECEERGICVPVFLGIFLLDFCWAAIRCLGGTCASRALCAFCSTSQESLGDGSNGHLIKFVHWKLFCFARNPQLQRDSTTWWLRWSTGWFPHLSVRLVQVKIIRLAAFCLPKVMSGRLAVTRNGGRKSFHVVNACREDLLALEICRLDSLPVSVHQCWCDLRWY